MEYFRHSDDAVAYPAGAVVIEEGSIGAHMYVVADGEIEIRLHGKALERLGPGAIVGEMALIDEHERSATVVAITDARLVPIDRKRFLYLVQNTPRFAIDVMRVIVERLRKMDMAKT